jgi:hypothetical protein
MGTVPNSHEFGYGEFGSEFSRIRLRGVRFRILTNSATGSSVPNSHEFGYGGFGSEFSRIRLRGVQPGL